MTKLLTHHLPGFLIVFFCCYGVFAQGAGEVHFECPPNAAGQPQFIVHRGELYCYYIQRPVLYRMDGQGMIRDSLQLEFPYKGYLRGLSPFQDGWAGLVKGMPMVIVYDARGKIRTKFRYHLTRESTGGIHNITLNPPGVMDASLVIVEIPRYYFPHRTRIPKEPLSAFRLEANARGRWKAGKARRFGAELQAGLLPENGFLAGYHFAWDSGNLFACNTVAPAVQVFDSLGRFQHSIALELPDSISDHIAGRLPDPESPLQTWRFHNEAFQIGYLQHLPEQNHLLVGFAYLGQDSLTPDTLPPGVCFSNAITEGLKHRFLISIDLDTGRQELRTLPPGARPRFALNGWLYLYPVRPGDKEELRLPWLELD